MNIVTKLSIFPNKMVYNIFKFEPDTNLAGYLAKQKIYRYFFFKINIQILSFEYAVIRPAGYPANETGYLAGFRVYKKVRVSGTTLL